jgi:GNAT superfamily N-acetyltransferase
MHFLTKDEWDEELWQTVRNIYHDAFANHGGKPEKVLRNMFVNCHCHLHVIIDRNCPIGMAITGEINGSKVLIIDYLAIKPNYRGQGLGENFFHYIKTWATLQEYYDYLLLEVEINQSKESSNRIQFWEKCGFTMLRDYIHQYIWVPEPYQAMHLSLYEQLRTPFNGKQAFKYITAFHRKSFRGTS